MLKIRRRNAREEERLENLLKDLRKGFSLASYLSEEGLGTVAVRRGNVLEMRCSMTAIRQVYVARLFKVRYVPSFVASTAFALSEMLQTNVTISMAPELALKLQTWDAYVNVWFDDGYDLSDFSRNLLEKAAPRLLPDIAEIRNTSGGSFVRAIPVADKLQDHDKVLLLSTLRILDGALEDVVRKSSGEPVESSRPTLDGYVRNEFMKVNFEQKLEELLGAKWSEVEMFWNGVREYILGMLPALLYYPGIEEKEVVSALAETLIELKELYVRRKEIAENVRRSLDRVLAGIANVNDSVRRSVVENVVRTIVPDDEARFAEIRAPYVFYRLCQRLGIAMDLRRATLGMNEIRALVKGSVSIVAMEKALAFALYEHGKVFLHPYALLRHHYGTALVNAIERTLTSPENLAYSFYYGLGIPSMSFERCHDLVYANHLAPMKRFVEELHHLYGVDFRMLPLTLGPMNLIDEVIARYVQREKERRGVSIAMNPHFYQSLLYIYTSSLTFREYGERAVQDELLIRFSQAIPKLVKVAVRLQKATWRQKLLNELNQLLQQIDEIYRRFADLAFRVDTDRMRIVHEVSVAIYRKLLEKLGEASATRNKEKERVPRLGPFVNAAEILSSTQREYEDMIRTIIAEITRRQQEEIEKKEGAKETEMVRGLWIE